METCREPQRWRESLSAMLDGEDPAIARVEVDSHLLACTSCSAWYETARAHRQVLAGEPVRDISALLIGVAEAHICPCHTGGECLCTDCICEDCTCQQAG
ncbi:hypothetical protein GCM10027030_00980 [Luteococcus sediminum]|uniref:zf-HC2 domain-containing protein n=1 Tax=Luteococcus sp. TaxID=1969402 RepID=UPI0037361427